MTDRPRVPAGDPRFRAWLDGEMTPEEEKAFLASLESDPSAAEEVETWRRLEDWVRSSRPSAPPHLADAVMRSIEQGSEARHGERSGTSWIHRLRPSWIPRIRWAGPAWVLVPAVAAIALAIVLRGAGHPSQVAKTGPAVSPSEVAQVAAPPARVHCEFRLKAQHAQQVCLVGSFNLWKICETPLRPADDGTWEASLDLPPGRYEYMFVVDGRWVSDPGARQRIDDGFGRENAVLLL